MEEEKNEFEELSQENEQEIQDTESLVSSTGGQEYDFNSAPDTVKAPDRVDLDGQEVTIIDAKLILPSKNEPWTTPQNKSPHVYKACQLKLFYSEGGQQEFYSGTKVFKNEDGTYTHPSIHTDGKSQASQLLGVYAKFKGKKIEEVSLKEFLGFLASKPKARIKGQQFTNPKNGNVIKKNMVGEFLQ